MINCFLEDVVAGSTSLEFFHREDCVEFEDFDANLDNVVIRESENKAPTRNDPTTVPVIRSQIGSKKRNTLRSNLLTFEARNFNADRGVDISCSDVVSDILVDNFFSRCIDSSKLEQANTESINVNLRVISDWLSSRTGTGYGALVGELQRPSDVADGLTNFKIMVKSDAKPKLDESIISKVSTGQNIVYHKRKINAIFSNIFLQVVERLKFALAHNIVLYTGMNTDDFAREVEDRIGCDINSFFCSELDISKYDKSQGALFKQVEEKILARLGVSPGVLDLWYASEYESCVTSADRTFSGDIGAQRRSGASNTWLGNTLINMCLQSYCTDFSDFPCICFAGDDSLIFSRSPLANVYGDIQTHFGFDMKFYERAVPYFCSKYLVSDGSKLFFVPDPYKVLVKLGRLTSSKESLCHENFQSLCDSVKYLNNETIINMLVFYHHCKYGPTNYTYGAFASIHCITANFSQFRRLFIRRNAKSFGFDLNDS
ncbi:RdRp [Pistachio ampelovirus A]|uniref:RdRp n=1 Tax=Pistachio ampelovirus A TaxID=2093224 RepID=A0A499PLR1_9CLOS|nr:RdRp [Pistachio ampelovirus A]AVN99305.1 RdRp [Pistachio ampelovirus A]